MARQRQIVLPPPTTYILRELQLVRTIEEVFAQSVQTLGAKISQAVRESIVACGNERLTAFLCAALFCTEFPLAAYRPCCHAVCPPRQCLPLLLWAPMPPLCCTWPCPTIPATRWTTRAPFRSRRARPPSSRRATPGIGWFARPMD